MWESIVLFFKNIFRFGGGKQVSQEAMEKRIDEFQEQYGVDESELGEVFKNKDKSKWRNEKGTSTDDLPIELDPKPTIDQPDEPDDTTFDDSSFDDGKEK